MATRSARPARPAARPADARPVDPVRALAARLGGRIGALRRELRRAQREREKAHQRLWSATVEKERCDGSDIDPDTPVDQRWLEAVVMQARRLGFTTELVVERGQLRLQHVRRRSA